MKRVYLIGGTMGVGKTSVCNVLKRKLNNSVFLDGDWCWDAHPFTVTEETKAMVMENICYLLNNFIRCSEYENIIFCWVMHMQEIIDDIISRIDTKNCELKIISLVCDEENLRNRLFRDIAEGRRTADIVEKSIARIPLYDKLNTVKIDTSNKTIDEITEKIKQI